MESFFDVPKEFASSDRFLKPLHEKQSSLRRAPITASPEWVPKTAPTVSRPLLLPDLFHLRVVSPVSEDMATILTPAALHFVEELEKRFGERLRALLSARTERIERIQNFDLPEFSKNTQCIRDSEWSVSPRPPDIQKRFSTYCIELVAPAERRSLKHALKSEASTIVVDFEDSLAPTWENVVMGQVAARELVAESCAGASLDSESGAAQEKATIMVRPRGWHLYEKNLRFDGAPISASLFDFALYCFHNAKVLTRFGSGVYFYLPKIESYLEARLWNDVFNYAQERLNLQRGSIRACILIETVSAAMEMDEILFELKDYALGLNAGRTDYQFSAIKNFGYSSAYAYSQSLMDTSASGAFSQLLISICHKRGVTATGTVSSAGGVCDWPPESEVEIEGETERRREGELDPPFRSNVGKQIASDLKNGFDAIWVNDPSLVSLAIKISAELDLPRTKSGNSGFTQQRKIKEHELLPSKGQNQAVKDANVSRQITQALRFISSTLSEDEVSTQNSDGFDAAAAELARAQLWQWVHHGVQLTEGHGILTRTEFQRRLAAECARYAGRARQCRISEACNILEKLVLSDHFPEYLTLAAYEKLH